MTSWVAPACQQCIAFSYNSKKDIKLCARRLMLLSVARPSIEHESVDSLCRDGTDMYYRVIHILYTHIERDFMLWLYST